MGRVRSAIFGLMFVFNCALALVFGFFIHSRGYVAGAGFTSSELVTIILTSLAVILAALGVFIALLAVWGYRYFMTVARHTAEQVASKRAEEIASRAAADVMMRLDSTGPSDRDYGAAASKENGDEIQ